MPNASKPGPKLAELAGTRTRNALIAIYRATALLEIFNASTTRIADPLSSEA
jgi:hypothetical protein